jgi:uncharacterized protein (DUF1684 family)
MTTSAEYSLAVADWRRQVHELYRDVRERAEQAGPAQAHEFWVAGRTALFDTHPASARMPGQALRHARYDPDFRFVLPILEREPDSFQVNTGTDGIVPFERVGAFDLADLGTLDVWWIGTYGGGLFVPLRDTTAGASTYGAGRYLLDTVKGADLGRSSAEHWVIDLNFAYNPSCVYNPEWACPLAPAGNRLPVDVPVGELLPTGY